MEWIQSRCGPGIELVVPAGAGSSIDRSARVFANALGNSGVRPVPVVVNYAGGVFSANGGFSVQKFDAWHRARGTKEACLLVIVPEEAREAFGTPRYDAMLGGKAYGIVLPRGLVAEAALRWSTIFVKAINDPDFVREIGNTGMRVEYVPAR
jgi:tripartite-type tricarboxylate transporter receptor subunit TctC